VKALETLTPNSTSDRAAIEALAANGEVLSAVDRSTVLGQILPRILQVRGRIPSFFTLFQDANLPGGMRQITAPSTAELQGLPSAVILPLFR
jgi:hypothetical protein